MSTPTIQQKLSLRAFERIFEESGRSREEINRAYHGAPSQNWEEYLDTLWTMTENLELASKFGPAYQELLTTYNSGGILPESWLQPEDNVPAAALAQAAEMSSEAVDEALQGDQRAGATNPSREEMAASSVDSVSNSDLIEKATQARQWDKQKQAYDSLYKIGSFAQGMSGKEMGPYAFGPAMTPRSLSPQELIEERGKLIAARGKIAKLQTDIELGKQRSQNERERTRRELTILVHKTREDARKTLTTDRRATVESLEKQRATLNERYAEIVKELQEDTNPSSATISTEAGDFGANNGEEDRSKEAVEGLNKLTDPSAKYLYILALNRQAVAHHGNTFSDPKGDWLDSSEGFVERAIALMPSRLTDAHKTALTEAHDHYNAKFAEKEELHKQGLELNEDIHEILLPGYSAEDLSYLRITDPFFKGTFEEDAPGDASSYVAAPSGTGAAAENYVASVVPGATLAGSDVTLPSGKVQSYSEFSASFPQARVSSRGQILPETAPDTLLTRLDKDITKSFDALEEPQLSDMDELKEEIIKDPRFGKWMDKNGYTSQDKAFEFFKKEFAQLGKMRGPATDRQKRDAHILAGRAPASRAETIGATARTAVGPAGKEARQSNRERRRQNLLQMLSPGPKSSRITETDAAEETTVGAAPETAKVTPETAPSPAAQEARLPTTWTDKDKWAEYTIDADGNITYVSPGGSNKGKTVTVAPGERGYDAILEYRTEEYGIPEADGWSEETQAKGNAYIDAMVEGGVRPTGLPEEVTTAREEWKEELASVPGAETREGASPEETERIGLRERLRYGKEERALGEKSLATEEAAPAEEAAPKEIVDAALAARDAARAKGEEPPAWAIAVLDVVPLEGLDRGEIERATTEPSATEGTYVSPGEGTLEGPGVPLAPLRRSERSADEPIETENLRKGLAAAKERTVRELPPVPRGQQNIPVGALSGKGGVPPTAEEERLFEIEGPSDREEAPFSIEQDYVGTPTQWSDKANRLRDEQWARDSSVSGMTRQRSLGQEKRRQALLKDLEGSPAAP